VSILSVAAVRLHKLYLQLGLAPPPQDMLQPRANWTKLSKHLEELLGTDFYRSTALLEVEKAVKELKGIRASTVLSKLYVCGYDNLLLYRRLVTLKDDLDLKEILHDSFGHESYDEAHKLLIERGVLTEDALERLVTEATGAGNDLKSSFFRYTGEVEHVVQYLQVIHPHLLKALRILREQYHRLERTM